MADIPAEINLSVELEDAEALGEWLAGKRERSCHLHRPQRGEKHRLLDMASKNARHALMRYMMRTGYADDRTNQALLELESALALPSPPLRIECFDISTLHGTFTVASMVVFTNGRADKSQYRRFKIQAELYEANDFVSMSEVLGRRYAPGRQHDGSLVPRHKNFLIGLCQATNWYIEPKRSRKFAAYLPMLPRRSTRRSLRGMPSAPRRRLAIPIAKHEPKLLIYMIA